jgi:hypothetical protein
MERKITVQGNISQFSTAELKELVESLRTAPEDTTLVAPRKQATK